VVNYYLHESGFRAKDLKKASIGVTTQEHPESVVEAEHPDSARCVRSAHLLLQDRRLSIIHRTIYPSR
jgi:hypothetical protein